jgi:signal transduction histidine kinase
MPPPMMLHRDFRGEIGSVFARKPVRYQLYYGAATLLVVVLVLANVSFQGVQKFRRLTKGTRDRAMELPLAAELHQRITDLRVGFSQIGNPAQIRAFNRPDPTTLAYALRIDLAGVYGALAKYQHQLGDQPSGDPRITDTSGERAVADELHARLKRVDRLISNPTWVFDEGVRLAVGEELEALQHDVGRLPLLMQERMDQFAAAVRTEYHAWMTITALMTVLAVLLIAFLAVRFQRRIFRPVEVLVRGSRQVAKGNYDCRVTLKTNDEFSELADALNAMTSNFQEIRRDLNQQVQQRTKEVIRGEQLASVGFLAAGVAHEINNPLAAIAWSAESLESRLHDILEPATPRDPAAQKLEIDNLKKYLQRIQDEAFRCKGITSGLLDFARLGDAKKTATNMSELVEHVVEMVRPLGKYRDKIIDLSIHQRVVATINAQEIKQVVLNLLTNALDSVGPHGVVRVRLAVEGAAASLTVEDNGCGMTEEVLEHLFEPFFTRRRDGHGTGLGLSIAYRIIEEHGGTIRPASAGPGRGATFTVTLPLVQHESTQRQAA